MIRYTLWHRVCANARRRERSGPSGVGLLERIGGTPVAAFGYPGLERWSENNFILPLREALVFFPAGVPVGKTPGREIPEGSAPKKFEPEPNP